MRTAEHFELALASVSERLAVPVVALAATLAMQLTSNRRVPALMTILACSVSEPTARHSPRDGLPGAAIVVGFGRSAP